METVSREQTAPLKKTALWLAIITLMVMIVWFSPSENRVWDPSFYWAHLISPIVDGDIDFRDNTVTSRWETAYTVTGLQNSHYPVGTSILWAPFFVLAHLLTLVFAPQQANGLSDIYLIFVSSGSAMYGLAALYLIFRICIRFTTRSFSLLTTVACGLATPLFFYIFRQPFMAHTTGLFASVLMLYIYLKLTENEALAPWSGVWFGIALGLCVSTRYYSIVMGIVPLVYYFDILKEAGKTRHWSDIRPMFWQVLYMLLTSFVLFSPQIAVWYRLHNKFLVFPSGPDKYVDVPYLKHLVNIFLSTNRGLLFWCPFILLGIIGLWSIKHKRVRFMAFVYLIVLILTLVPRKDWYGGGAYGARYWIEFLPFAALGFISICKGLFVRKQWRYWVMLVLVLFIVHQLTLVYSVEHGAQGWIDVQLHYSGQPLGLRWQFDNFFRLLRDPMLYFNPRPMEIANQSILVNLVNGIRNKVAYAITAPAAVLAALCVYAMVRLFPLLKRKHVHIAFSVVMVWFVIWAVVFALVG